MNNNLNIILGMAEMSKTYRLSLLMNLTELAFNKFNFFNCKFYTSFQNNKIVECTIEKIKRKIDSTQIEFKMGNNDKIYIIDAAELPNHALEDIFNHALKIEKLNNIAIHSINLN